jgi:hypothetical protein
MGYLTTSEAHDGAGKPVFVYIAKAVPVRRV